MTIIGASVCIAIGIIIGAIGVTVAVCCMVGSDLSNMTEKWSKEK